MVVFRVGPQATSEMERLLHERTLEAIERLASGVAHKFNNLLQVIQGYAELGFDHVRVVTPSAWQPRPDQRSCSTGGRDCAGVGDP